MDARTGRFRVTIQSLIATLQVRTQSTTRRGRPITADDETPTHPPTHPTTPSGCVTPWSTRSAPGSRCRSRLLLRCERSSGTCSFPTPPLRRRTPTIRWSLVAMTTGSPPVRRPLLGWWGECSTSSNFVVACECWRSGPEPATAGAWEIGCVGGSAYTGWCSGRTIAHQGSDSIGGVDT